MFTTNKLHLLSNAFSVLTVAFVIAGTTHVYDRFAAPIFADSQTATQTSIHFVRPLPVQLTIPSLHLNVPITSENISDQDWEIPKNSVSFIDNPEILGKPNGTILVGHNWEGLLADLDKVRVGDEFNITYHNDTTKHFEVTDIQEVSPDNVRALHKGDIAIFTCSGFLDSQRLVVSAVEK